MSDRCATRLLPSAVLAVCSLCLAAPPALDDPLIKGITPAKGQAGQQILITGVNFGTSPEVSFDGTLASVDAYRPDIGRLVAVVPTSAASGPITVRNTDTAKTSNPADFERLSGTFTAACTISGTVTDDGGSPLAGAFAVAADPREQVFARIDETGASGTYSLGLDPAGDYQISFVPPQGSTYVEVSYDVTCAGTQDHQFAIGEELSGRVVDASQSPVENARVVAAGSGDAQPLLITGATGEFSLWVAAGTYDVLAEAPVGSQLISELLEDVDVTSNTDVGDIELADGVLVEGLVQFQDGAEGGPAMNAFVQESDFDGTLSGATTSIADGSFYLGSPSGDSYNLWVSGDGRNLEDQLVSYVEVTGAMELDYPIRLYSSAGQVPSRPVIYGTDALEVSVGQRIVFEAAHFRGTTVDVLFPDGEGGVAAGVDTLAEVDRGGVVTTVPGLAVSGDVVLRVDGVDSPGYPLTISGTFTLGPYTTTGVVDDGASPVEGAFVAILKSVCYEEALHDYDLTAADGSYSVQHGTGDHYLLVLPPVESGLVRGDRALPGLTGGGTVNVSLDSGHPVTARCIDSGIGVVGGSDPVSDCLVTAEGLSLDLEEDALGDDGGETGMNLPSGSYEFEVIPPFRSRFTEDDSSEQEIDGPTDFGDVEMDSGYFIEGRVVDPLGGGLAGVEVEAFDHYGWWRAGGTTTVGQDGSFVLSVPGGSYDLYFEVHDDQEYYVPPVFGLDATQDTLVYPAIEAEDVGRIEGTLTDDVASPVGGVEVKAWHESHGVVDETRSCDDGSYSLRAAIGDYTVQALPSEEGLCLADEYYDDHYLGCGADTVSVTAIATYPGIDFAFEAAGSISGTLTDDAGSPVADASVCASNGATLPFCASVCALSDDDGSYLIRGVPVGDDYTLQASGANFPLECWDDHVNCLDYDPVAVADCVETTGIDFLMSGAPGPVPDGHNTPGRMMTAEYDKDTDILTIKWQNTCSADNHAAFFGDLGSFSSYTSAECVMGLTESHPLTPPAGDVFWVVVGVNTDSEGSFGVDSDLAERPSDEGALCGYTYDLSATCVP